MHLILIFIHYPRASSEGDGCVARVTPLSQQKQDIEGTCEQAEWQNIKTLSALLGEEIAVNQRM